MSKGFIWLGISVLGLSIVGFAAMVLLPALIDARRWKPDLEARASEAIGHRLSIEGDIQLTLLPRPEVCLSEIRVANPVLPQEDLLKIRVVRMEVNPLPLLLGRINAGEVTVEDLYLMLGRDTSGRWIWERQPQAPARTGPPEENDTRPLGRGRPLERAVGSHFGAKEVFVRRGKLTFADGLTGARCDLDDLTLTVVHLLPGRRPRVSASGTFKGHRVALEGQLGPVSSDFLQDEIPVDLSIQLAGRQALRIRGEISPPWCGPRFDLSLDVPPFSASGLLRLFGQNRIGFADAEVLKTAEFKARIRGDETGMIMEEGVLNLDKSTLSLSAMVSWLDAEQILFHAVVDQVDLNTYLPALTPGPRSSKGGEKPSRATDADRQLGHGPPGKWSNLRAQGDLKVKLVRFRGARFEDVLINISFQEGILALNSIMAKGYDGSWCGRGVIDLTRDRPRAELEVSADALNVGPLLHDIATREFLQGTLQGNIALHAEPLDLKDPLPTLHASGDLAVKDGAILGLDLAHKVRSLSPFRRREAKDSGPATHFSALSLVFELSAGILETKRSLITVPGLRIHAQGKASLLEETLELRLQPEVLADLTEGKKGEGPVALGVPILVTGKFSSPLFEPDLGGLPKGKGRVILSIPGREKLKDYIKSLSR